MNCEASFIQRERTGFPIVGGRGYGGSLPHPTIFSKAFPPPRPLKTNVPPMGCTPHLKMKTPPSSEKQPSPIET